MGSKVFKVCLLGCSFETGNMGVSALTASLISIIKRIQPKAEISLLIPHDRVMEKTIQCNGTQITIKSLPFRLSPFSPPSSSLIFVTLLSFFSRNSHLRKIILKMSPLLRLIDESDFIGDIHAGDSFSDIYGFFRFWTGCQPLLWVLRLGKPLHMLPQTYGPFASDRSRNFAAKILKLSSSILARDDESREMALALSDKNEIHVVPDVAFCLEPIEHPGNYSEVTFADPTKQLIGINISGLLFNGGYTKNNMFGLKMDYADYSLRLAERIMKETSCNIIFVPHTVASPSHVEDDRTACKKIAESLPREYKGRIFVSEHDYDQNQIKYLIGKCSLFIGARMHACIAALSQGIPTIGVAYSMKFRGVFSVAGRPEWVLSAMETDTETALNFSMRFISTQSTSRETLLKNVQSLQEKIHERFKEKLR